MFVFRKLNITMKEEDVIRKIIQIREINGLTKRELAEKLEMNEASYGRIESGKIALSYKHLAQIASVLNMSVIDILTYPKKFAEITSKEEEPVEAILQIKLKREKKEQVLKLVFGENNIEILNK